jgi:nitric oxide reductase large subunit
MYAVKMIYDYFEVTQDSAQREYLSKINTAMTILLAGTSVILLFIGAGVFGDTSNIPNASLLLLIGMCLGIFYMLGIVILKSRTSIDKNWPIAQIQEEMARR